MENTVGALILAAGNSSRMGKCKFLLPMSNGVTFIENIVQTFGDYGVKNIVIVSQTKYITDIERICNKLEVKPSFVANDSPEKERFYSLQLGIEVLKDCEFIFMHNADSPFVDLATLEELDKHKNKADYICPVYENRGGHPILVNKSTMEHLLSSPMDGNLKNELQTKQRLNVSVDNELITVDVDTPEEYNKYFN